MKRFDERSWKVFYSQERKRMELELDRAIEDALNGTYPQIERIITKGGALSFPHTYLKSTMGILSRISASLYRKQPEKVIAFGVIHGMEDYRIENEFSLDNFEYVFNRTAELLDVDPIPLEKVYPTDGLVLSDDPSSFIEKLKERGSKLKGSLDDRTGFVMTGDLAHYGYGYGNHKDGIDPQAHMNQIIERSLEKLYKEKDYQDFLDYCMRNFNDQIGPGIMVSTILGSPLSYRIFTRELTDYSAILDCKKPTLVASVFYGVWNDHSG